jgi:hypothetical protein
MLTTQQAWFPLRSNLAFFETGRGRMTLEQRIKQSVILCDELWFEAGMVTLDVAEHFVMGPMWHSPQGLTDERIAMHRKAARRGTPFSLAIGTEPAFGVPAPPEAMRTIGGGPRQRGFVGEYQQLLTRTRLVEQSWVNRGLVDPAAEERVKALETELSRFDTIYAREAPKLSKNHLLDGNLKSSLNHDLAVSAVHGAPAMIDQLHGRMLAFKVKHAQASANGVSGADALSLWVPDFSSRPWHDVIALHDHDAIGKFREKLAEAEAETAGLTGRARERALAEIGLRETTEALRRRFPSVKRRALDVALEAFAGLVFGRLAVVASAAKELTEARQAETAWTAVYLALRSPS